MSTQIGIAVIWGVGTTTNIESFGTYKLQGRDYSRKATKTQVRDEGGNTAGLNFSDYIETCTFRTIPSAASGSAVTPVLPQIGDSFSIPDTTLTQISGGLWIVEDAGFKATNESAMVAEIEAYRYAGITS